MIILKLGETERNSVPSAQPNNNVDLEHLVAQSDDLRSSTIESERADEMFSNNSSAQNKDNASETVVEDNEEDWESEAEHEEEIEEEVHQTASIEDDEEREDEDNSELDENQFAQYDTTAASIEENSFVDNYLRSIQERLKGSRNQRRGHKPEEYNNGTFWVSTKSPSFMLSTEPENASQLYTPRVFLWFPHHLDGDLKCPICNEKIEVKGFNKKPRARRIIDLNEYGFFCILLRSILVIINPLFKLVFLDDVKI